MPSVRPVSDVISFPLWYALTRIFVQSLTERIGSKFPSLTGLIKISEKGILNVVHTLLFSCLAGVVAMAVDE